MGAEIADSVVMEAYSSVHASRRASADDILVSPSLRSEFLSLVRERMAEADEEPTLRRLLNLRKRSRLPRCR
jgi:hypothetical protein